MPKNQDSEFEIADIDPTPQELDEWKKSLPPNVRDEIEQESDAQNTEMIHKFEMHAFDYEKAHPETAPDKKKAASAGKD